MSDKVVLTLLVSLDLAMHDKSLLMERLAARRLQQKYNLHPWPESGDDYFGPDERRQLLADLFGLTLDDIKNKPIEIEPPFRCE
jgi:maltose O-acetyltransferase